MSMSLSNSSAERIPPATWCMPPFCAGKPVVTANKLLLAEDVRLEGFDELRYSAAVGGAVPALEAVQALADDGRIVSLSGVLNGTCNYILDRIAAGCSWEQAVAEAQANGFAEQDPRADLSGSDTVCKLRLLARRAFPEIDKHYISATGIEAIDPDWVQSAVARRQSRPAGWYCADFGWSSPPGSQAAIGCSDAPVRDRFSNEENCLLIDTQQSDSATGLDGSWRWTMADDRGGDGRSLRPQRERERRVWTKKRPGASRRTHPPATIP